MGEVEKRLKEKGIELPPPPSPMGAYVPAVVTGSLVFVSGQLPRWGNEMRCTGKVDAELDLVRAREAARLAALNAVSVLKAAVSDLDRVRRIVKLRGSVASSPGFVNQPEVVNAASEVMVEVFGEAGKHARMAVGVAELPGRASVGIEIIAEIGGKEGKSKK
jgi:enamine deaminase RidA (YjgF/YER057c/UK114 family)